jgi:predicted Zn-dependent peptidase
MRTIRFAIALLACATAAPLAAQVPAQMPPLGAPKPFNLPAGETFTLPNGMQVTLVPYGLSPKSVVILRVLAGTRNEGDQVWLAVLGAELMKEGAAGRSPNAISDAAANMGGDLTVGAGMQSTTLGIGVLSEHTPEAIALLGDVALRPTLPADELPRIKANLQRNLTLALSQPGTLADVAITRAYYGDHPYGRLIPTAAQLAGYTIDDVKHFYASQFGAKRAHLYVAGRFDAAAVRAAIIKTFGGWAAGPEPLALPPSPIAGPRVLLIDRPGAPQSTLRILFPARRAGSPEDIPQRVENSLLGGSFNSRITTNIREDKGYTYSPGSAINFEPDDARWVFNADVTTSVTGPALKEVFAEIRRLQTTPPSEEEAMGARRYLAGNFVLRNSTAPALLGSITSRDLLGLPANWLDTYVPAVLAVTPQQFSDIARASLPLDKLSLVVVGDLKTVEPQLKALPELANIPFQHVTVP